MTVEATLLAILREQRETNALLRGLRADIASWQEKAGTMPYGTPWHGTRWEAATTHISPTGTIRSGWVTPPSRYMHEQGYLYGCPSMVGP